MTDHSKILEEYKGLPVTGTVIIVNKLGDGLSKAVDVEPIVTDIGEDVYISCRVRKSKERYDAIRDDAGTPIGYTLVQIFDATGAMFTDAKLTKAGIAKMLERISIVEAERKGQLSLALDSVTAEVAQKVNDAMGKKDS